MTDILFAIYQKVVYSVCYGKKQKSQFEDRWWMSLILWKKKTLKIQSVDEIGILVDALALKEKI